MQKKIRVSMVGCCLVDRLYNIISFTNAGFIIWISRYDPKRYDLNSSIGQITEIRYR
jgi:hypothetical protein